MIPQRMTPISTEILKFSKNFCFLDLETTGFDSEKDSIIEIAFIREQDGKTIETLDQVLIPEKSEISDFVTHLTGITLEEIKNKGKKIEEIRSEIETKIGTAVIVGHNIDFDINFLVKNGIRIEKNPRIDTHELARILLPHKKSYALEILAEDYGLLHENAHRAMSDVLACRSLFAILLQKIKELPVEFTNEISEFLETKTNWHAKYLFLDSKNQKFSEKISLFAAPATKEDEECTETNGEITPGTMNIPETLFPLTNKNTFVLLGNNVLSATFFSECAQKLKKTGKKVMIITPKTGYFSQFPQFPTPGVIFCPEKLENFSARRETLNKAETVFYLKCKYRHFLGFRGVSFFDIFFKESDFWDEVHAQENTEYFESIFQEKIKNEILVITPNAFFEFFYRPEFLERVILIDESEVFFRELLFFPEKSLVLKNYFVHADQQISTSAQFFTARFCREVIETKLGHPITPFPEKVRLETKEDFSGFSAELENFLEVKDFDFWQNTFLVPSSQATRWVSYFPETGNLIFSYWHPDDWRKMKKHLDNFEKILGYRHVINEENIDFFKIFGGIDFGTFLEIPEILESKHLIIPEELVSVKSPDFNNFSGEKILEFFMKTSGNLAVNFSGLEALRRVFDFCAKKLENTENVFLCGEKVSGGNGKLLELMKKNKNKRILFFFYKFRHPFLETFLWDAMVLQKFPFVPPHPLFEKTEEVMNQSGKKFWDIFTMPQLEAEISRKIGNFSKSEMDIYILDSRENSKWGKKILQNLFPNRAKRL